MSTVAEPLVRRSVDGGVATLTLNRPDKLNALLPQTFTELSEHLVELEDTEGVRCLVLTGAGRSFCAGLDLGNVPDLAALRRAAETIDQLEAFRLPTIAKIRGHCMTGGLELALGCDLLVASQSAQFADTHSKFGLAPLWGMTVRLPERIGRARAKELAFTAKTVDGRTADAIGLVDHCVSDDRLDEAVEELAASILANSADTNRIYKSLLAHHAGVDRVVALQFERKMPFTPPAANP